jgi:hypothetical protein
VNKKKLVKKKLSKNQVFATHEQQSKVRSSDITKTGINDSQSDNE